MHVTRVITTALVAVAVIWLISFAAFYSKIQNLIPHEKQGDGIVVLTGGTGRINAGLEMLERDLDKKLLISGVDKAVTIDELVTLTGYNRELFDCCVTLGRQAGDTLGNAAETISWAKAEKIKSLTIVTANYHMPRAMIALENASSKLKFYQHPVKAEVSLRYLIIEFNKYIVAVLTGTPS